LRLTSGGAGIMLDPRFNASDSVNVKTLPDTGRQLSPLILAPGLAMGQGGEFIESRSSARHRCKTHGQALNSGVQGLLDPISTAEMQLIRRTVLIRRLP
jgi:hypothetical protein